MTTPEHDHEIGRLTTVWEPLEAIESELGSAATIRMSIRPELDAASDPDAPTAALPDLGVTLPEPPPEGSSDGRAPGETARAREADTDFERPDAPADRARSAEGLADAAVGEANPDGEFRLGDRLGAGGMGEVFRAVQSSLGREVAVKVTREETGRKLDRMFVAEARVTGFLDHANIVPVHALGRGGDSRLHLAMKLVRGRTWDELIHRGDEREGAVTLDRHIEVFLAVCNAVAFAHDRGVIHRDLKPENVMVGEFGQVFVMDWGLAAPIEAALAERIGASPASASTSPAGTPAYMAPELAVGDGESQDERTDVYLLGACLFEAASGRRRHQGGSLREVMTSAVKSEPVDAAEVGIDPELAAICNRATARERSERFASVAELRGAVEAFGERQQARAMIDKGRALIARIRAAIAGAAGDGADRQQAEMAIHNDHAAARFAFESALELWTDAAPAREGLAEASRIVLEHAIEIEDVAAARRLARDCDDEALRERAAELERRLATRDVELRSLRDRARRTDWSAVESALGTLMVISGVAISGATLIVDHGVRQDDPSFWMPAILGMWFTVLPLLGGIAWALLRRTNVPDSLLVGRLVGTWGTVALACLLNQAVVVTQGLPERASGAGAALLLGIGFAGMAFQTRRWLLVPAIVFLAMAVPIAWLDQDGLRALAATWLVTFMGAGLALHAGAGLAQPSPAETGG